MTFGNVMHTTIKEFVGEIQKRGNSPASKKCLAIYEREWSAAGFTDDFHEQEYRKAGREQLEAFHQTYSAAPADVLHQEKRFELPLEHEVVVTGRMDQVNRIAEAKSKSSITKPAGLATQKKRRKISAQRLRSGRAGNSRTSPEPPRLLQSGDQ